MIGEETLWACTTCGYCEAACPIELEHLPKFFRLRQHRVMMEGEFPHELKRVFDAYEVQGNPWGLPADTRGDWAAAAGVAVLRERRGGEGARLPLLRGIGRVLRRARDARSQPRSRASCRPRA